MLSVDPATGERLEMTARDQTPSFVPPVWLDPHGEPLSCRDKIKVLNENLEEIREMCQDAFEDAILMGADEAQVRRVFAELVAAVDNPYVK